MYTATSMNTLSMSCTNINKLNNKFINIKHVCTIIVVTSYVQAIRIEGVGGWANLVFVFWDILRLILATTIR